MFFDVCWGLLRKALFFKCGGHRACILDGCRARLLQRAAPTLDTILFLIWAAGGRKRAGSWEEDGKWVGEGGWWMGEEPKEGLRRMQGRQEATGSNT